MHKLYLSVLLLFPLTSIAQSNYKSAFIINLKGDTTRGFIDYKEWGNNPKSISFKQTQGDKAKQLGLEDISYFEVVNAAAYKVYPVNISLNPIDISSPPSLQDTASTNETVFLKILNKGNILTLYSYTDALKKRFYIKENVSALPQELIYGVYQNPDNAGSVVDRNTYRLQLNQLVVKNNLSSDKLSRQILQSAYREEQILAVVAAINGNSKAPDSFKSDNPIFRLFAGGAFQSSTLKYPLKSPYYNAPPSTSIFPKITAGVDVFAKPDIGSLILRLELGYTQNKYNIVGQANPIYNEADPTTYTLKLKGNVYSVTPQVIYNFYNSAALKVFADVGFAVNIVSYNTNKVSPVRGGKPITTVTTKDSDLRGDYSSFQLKSGVVLSRKLEIYGAYFTNANATKQLEYTTRISSYQVGFNYFFGKVAH